MILKQEKKMQIAETLEIEIEKSTWQKDVKEKVISKVKKRIIEEMMGRTKCGEVGRKRIHKRKR